MNIGVDTLLPCRQGTVASRKPQLRLDHGALPPVFILRRLDSGVTRERRNTEVQ
jgi:hypothetical protein